MREYPDISTGSFLVITSRISRKHFSHFSNCREEQTICLFTRNYIITQSKSMKLPTFPLRPFILKLSRQYFNDSLEIPLREAPVESSPSSPSPPTGSGSRTLYDILTDFTRRYHGALIVPRQIRLNARKFFSSSTRPSITSSAKCRQGRKTFLDVCFCYLKPKRTGTRSFLLLAPLMGMSVKGIDQPFQSIHWMLEPAGTYSQLISSYFPTDPLQPPL